MNPWLAATLIVVGIVAALGVLVVLWEMLGSEELD